MSGQELNEKCNEQYSHAWYQCVGYIQGVFDAGKITPVAGLTTTHKRQWEVWVACPPNDVNTGQLLEVVKKWLRENPDKWHFPGVAMMGWAFSEPWPCP